MISFSIFDDLILKTRWCHCDSRFFCILLEELFTSSKILLPLYLLCLFLLGADRFIIPALLCITACLLLFRRRIEKTTAAATANENETGEGNDHVK